MTSTTKEPHNGTQPAGELTTIFTPTPPACKSTAYQFRSTECLPTRWNLYSGAASYYSPGICPSGYRSAAPVPTSGFGPPIEKTETAIVCCPTGYTFSADYRLTTSYFQCLSLSSSTTTRGAGAASTYLTSATVTATSYPSSTTVTSTSTAILQPIQVRWAESDIPTLETHPLTSGLKPSHTSTRPTASTKTSTPSSKTTSPSSSTPTDTSLSTGAKAGIGIGAALGALALLGAGLAFFLLRRRKKRRGGYDAASPHSPSLGPTGAGGLGTEKGVGASPASATVRPVSDSAAAGQGQGQYVAYSPYGAGGGGAEGGAGVGGNGETDAAGLAMAEEYRRVQERRARLLELERLEAEESRLRSQMALHRNSNANLRASHVSEMLGEGHEGQLLPASGGRSPVEAGARSPVSATATGDAAVVKPLAGQQGPGQVYEMSGERYA